MMYTGAMEKGQMHGKGALVYPNSEKYEVRVCSSAGRPRRPKFPVAACAACQPCRRSLLSARARSPLPHVLAG